MLTIRCAKCKRKLLKYNKIGRGKVLRCWFDRIREDYTVRKGGEVFCECGGKIGRIDGPKIKMIADAFTCSGTKVNK